jgi:hypothetical protein
MKEKQRRHNRENVAKLPDGFINNQKRTIWSSQTASGFVFGPIGFIWFSCQTYILFYFYFLGIIWI